MKVEVHEHAAGLSWVVTDEPLQRASHALIDGDRAWLVDPVADDDALERVAATGATVEGVLQLLDRHPRDGAALARRHDVELHRLPRALPDVPFSLFDVVSVPRWRERGLWWPGRRTLLVPEAIGTPPYFSTGTGAAGVHPFLRLLPPRALRRHAHDGLGVLLCGHGAPVTGTDAGAALGHALDRAWLDLPRVPLELLRGLR